MGRGGGSCRRQTPWRGWEGVEYLERQLWEEGKKKDGREEELEYKKARFTPLQPLHWEWPETGPKEPSEW